MADIADVLVSLMGGGLAGRSGTTEFNLPAVGGPLSLNFPAVGGGMGFDLPAVGGAFSFALPAVRRPVQDAPGKKADPGTQAVSRPRSRAPVGEGAGQTAAVADISLAGLGPGNREEFFRRAMRLGLAMEQQTGIPAEVFAAMFANESNFGNAPGNIAGGVKATPGAPGAVELDTWEMVNGQRVPMRQWFQTSGTALEGMQNVARTLQGGRYAPAYQALQSGQIDRDEFLRRVNAAGYATNPNWAQGEIVPLMGEASRYRATADQQNRDVSSTLAGQTIAAAVPNPAAQGFLAAAMTYQGVNYVWGGSSRSPGVDCSGLIIAAARDSGHPLPGRPTAQGIYNQVPKVDAANVQPGDLVFFEGTAGANAGERISHVGIVTEAGMMLNAPRPGTTVSVAPYNSAYWAPKIVGFGRMP